MRTNTKILDNIRINQGVSSVFHQASRLISFQSIVTGTPVGILKVEVSNDTVLHANEVTSWDTYLDSEINIAAAGTYTLEIREMLMRWSRITYVFNSGDGYITTNMFEIIKE